MTPILKRKINSGVVDIVKRIATSLGENCAKFIFLEAELNFLLRFFLPQS
jgi:hypothetical protein